MASVSRKPLLGVLLLVTVALVAGSALSSPPWPGSSPLLGLPRDACGMIGKSLSAVLLGYLGVAITIALWLTLVGLTFRSLLGLPRSPWIFILWSNVFAFVLSVFMVGVGHSEVWGEGPAALAHWISAGARLGPVGASLLTGGVLTLLVFWAAPRWTPAPVQDRAGDWAQDARDRMAEIPGSASDLAERALAGADGLRERMPSLPRPSLGALFGRFGSTGDDEYEDEEEEAAEAQVATVSARAKGKTRNADAEPRAAKGRRSAAATALVDAPSKGTRGADPSTGADPVIGGRGTDSAASTRGNDSAVGGRGAADRSAHADGPTDSLGRRKGASVQVTPEVAAALRSKAKPDDGVLAAVSADPRGAFPEEEWDEAEGEEDADLLSAEDEDDSEDEEYEDDEEYEEEDEDEDGEEYEYEDEDEDEDDEEEYEDEEEDEEASAEDDGIAPVLVPRKDAPRLPKRPKRPVKRGAYRLPPLDLLEPARPRLGTVSEQEVIEKSRILVKTLEDFSIQGAVGEVHPGPVITQYEYAPAAGVRISQIVSRSDDIALNMRAARIRIVAPIPGKAAIGIEVPNHQAEHIDFRTVLQELDLSDAHLPLCLGRDIRGRAQYGRLEKMPHLLVAGTTGSGKSVCLNTCLFSLLYNKTPDELRLLLIDPKMLELTVYDGIPHLLCPVVTDARMAARMLQWMVGEMERRYRKMATFGVRNIEGYHEKMKDKKVQREAEPMPYIVVVVDELADLMLTLGNEIETPIARLAQMARAVGIHLILATQRPSVDVITGVIKANFPGRIAFQVATKVDSRTIIDMNGAQDLLGKGDMLYLPPGQGKCVRLHGCFVSDQDAERLVAYLKEMPEPEPVFREEMLDKEGDGADIDDELFEDALRLVVFQKQASVSFLQRRLKVGYSRAGRLMDLLESIGAVGPHEGSKPREVLADESFVQEWVSRADSVAGK
ncbi:MAG: DNA translocase FtsK [Candidatus Eisenbacteria bacterium]